MKRGAGLVILVAFACIAYGCKKEQSVQQGGKLNTGTITFSFDHSVINEPLVFGQSYINDLGEPFTVNKFKYYIHDIELVNKKNEIVDVSDDYFLIDHDDERSRDIKLKAVADTFTNVAFTLGVDSARNVSGAQTGALDPVNGMFWTWSTGYVMAKLEGQSPVSTMSNQAFSLHVGGFKEPYIAVRKIQLPLPGNMIVVKDTSITMKIDADINTWFIRIHEISIARNPACHSPGKLASDIADNYEGMFSVEKVF